VRRLTWQLMRLARRLTRRRFPLRVDVALPTVRLGSDYGGWDVHLAGLNADSIIYSAGVGEDVSFDVELIERLGARVHAFDPTPRSIEWANRASLPEAFRLHEFGIAAADGQAAFHPPADKRHVSHTVLDIPGRPGQAVTLPVLRLSSIMARLGHERVDLLKLDVEGAEYQVIDDIVAAGLRPGQLLVEFHHRFPGVGLGRTRRAIRRLRNAGYRLFSVSASAEEFGFVLGGGER